MCSAGACPDISDAPPDSGALEENGRDVNGSVSVIRENSAFVSPSGSSGVSPPSFPPSGRSDVNSGLSFAGAVRGADPDPVGFVPDAQNDLPSRPLTVSFNPRTRVAAQEVFTALQDANIDSHSVSCVQRQSNGEIVLTFRNAPAKELFLTHNVVRIHGMPFALQDVDRPLTYVQVFDAPHEMPDATIIQRLSKYCDVLHHRRGYFREEGWTHVQDGVRHFRVRIKEHIPNFIRFGKVLIHFRYDGQPRTCRHCNQTGHFVNACHSIICFNCEELGHLASDCPHPVLCNICKQPDHRANTCPYSWSRLIENPGSPRAESQDETPREENPPDASSHEAVSHAENSEQDEESLVPLDNSLEDHSEEPVPTEPEHQMEHSTPEEYLSASEEPSATLELFATPVSPPPVNSPPPQPQRSRSASRRPARIQPTVIPSRTPTQPVLVTGKSRDDTADNPDEQMDTEQSKATKRKSPEKQRTNKHKKR